MKFSARVLLFIFAGFSIIPSFYIFMTEHRTIEQQVAYLSLQEEIMTRLEQMNSLEIEFLRQFQCHVKVPSSHPALIYQLRNLVFNIQDTFQGVKDYFKDIDMQFVYILFRKVHVLMVNGYNFLSQALLTHIDEAEIQKQIKNHDKDRQKLLMKASSSLQKKEDNGKALEMMDYKITTIESQQAKIKEQMNKIQDHLMLSKGLVQRLAPSKAVKELTEIKQQSQITLENSQKIFQEAYHLKYLQFKSYLSSLHQSQDLTKEMYDNIRIAVKNKFTNGIKRSVGHLYQKNKMQDRENMVDESMQTDEVQQNFAVQTKGERKFGMKPGDKIQNLLLKEKKFTQKLQYDITTLKKQIQKQKEQKLQIKQQLDNLSKKHDQLKQNNDALHSLYEQKRQDVNQLMNKLRQLNVQITFLREIEAKYNGNCNQMTKCTQTVGTSVGDRGVQVKLDVDSQVMNVLRKQNEKLREKVSQLQLLEAKMIKRKPQFESPSPKISTFKSSEPEPRSVDPKMTKKSLMTKVSIANNSKGKGTTSVEVHKSSEAKSSYKMFLRKTSIKVKSKVNLNTLKTQLTEKEQLEFEKQTPKIITKKSKHVKKSTHRKANKDGKNTPQEERSSHQPSHESKDDTIIINTHEPKSSRKNITIISSQNSCEKTQSQDIFEEVEMIDAGVQTSSEYCQSGFPTFDKKGKNKKKFTCDSQRGELIFKRSENMAKTVNHYNRRKESKQNTHIGQNMQKKLSKFNHTLTPNLSESGGEQSEQENEVNHFQHLNIPKQRTSLKKRGLFPKTSDFLLNSMKNKTEDGKDVKNRTLREEDFKAYCRQGDKVKTETDNIDKNILVIDKISHHEGRKTSKCRQHQRDKLKKNSEIYNIKENITGWY